MKKLNSFYIFIYPLDQLQWLSLMNAVNTTIFVKILEDTNIIFLYNTEIIYLFSIQSFKNGQIAWLRILEKHIVSHSKNEQKNPGRYLNVQPLWTNVMFIRLMSHQNIIHTFLW